MSLSISFRPPRWASILVVVAAAAAAIVAFPSVREPVLRAAGWALVVNEPSAPADIIVVSLDSDGARSGGPRAKRHRDARCGFYRPSEWRRSRVHPPGAPLRGCERKADSPTEVAWRDGYRANPQNRRWNR